MKTMAALLARAEAAEEKVQAYALRVERQEEQIGDLCKALDESRAQADKARRIVAERQGRLTVLQTEREDLRGDLESERQIVMALKARLYDSMYEKENET